MRFLQLLIALALILIAETVYSGNKAEWNLIANENNIRVYRLIDAKNNPFKAEGEIDATVEQVLNVILDFERKKEWSPKCEKVTEYK